MIDLTDDAYKIAQNVEDANVYFITTLAEQVRDITEAGSELNVIEQRELARVNIANIKKEMDKALYMSEKETNALLSKEAKRSYKNMRKYYKAKNVVQLPYNKNKRLLNQMRSIYRLTGEGFGNISRTTALSFQYQRCIDQSIMAVTSGAENYQVAIDRAVRQAVKRGPKIKYASGYQRRVDTAVRMNVLDGAREMQIEINKLTGQEFGADGMEIDAHGLCAPDHLEYQGQQYTNVQFDLLQAELDRPIGELNCQHIATPIVIGVSDPAYSDEQLEEINEYSTEKITGLSNKPVTRYEASQMMRQVETEVREYEEQLLQAQIRNRDALAKGYKRRIAKRKEKYKRICDKADLRPQYNRMKIVH